MKTLIVGGDFGKTPRSSGVVTKMEKFLPCVISVNGGQVENLPLKPESNLILWMPNINNEEPKHYPVKPVGSVLICSKVMHDSVTRIEAISRIFKMHGNAVICITKKQASPNPVFDFELIDALGNTWYLGTDLQKLCEAIVKFYDFTMSAVRIPSKKSVFYKDSLEVPNIEHFRLDLFINIFLNINAELANRIQTQCGNRFFGNVSTRCQCLFPTVKIDQGVLVSPRNSDKRVLSISDMVLCSMSNLVYYHNGQKPSVDAPIQLEIYKQKPKINYMIHGHAFPVFTESKPWFQGTTEHYKLCGDFNEAAEILSVMKEDNNGIIILKQHGFLIFGEYVGTIQSICESYTFHMPGSESV